MPADTSNNRIQKFAASGNFVAAFGSFGTGDGQFISPRDVVPDGAGHIYVADTDFHRIQKLDATTGDFISSFGGLGFGDGKFDYPMGLHIGQAAVFMLSTVAMAVCKCSPARLVLSKKESELHECLCTQ